MIGSTHIGIHNRWNIFLISGFFSTLLLSLAAVPQAVKAQTTLSSAKIEDMPVFAQQHYLSCEYSAARAAAARWGIYLRESDFISNIPSNDDPHLGFRGNIDDGWGGTESYGIYAEPIALFLNSRGLQTKLLWDGVEQVKQEVALGRPVVVWVAGGMGWSDTFTASANGNSFLMMPYEHAMTVYGYDEGGIYVADPGFGTYDWYSWTDFTRSWGYLGNMAMSVYPADAATPGEKPGLAPQFYRYWQQSQTQTYIGRPLAPAFTGGNKIYQYFERTRLEYDTTQPPNQHIGLGLLGQELTNPRYVEKPFQPLNPWELLGITSDEVKRYFPQTGYVLDMDFLDFWQNQGGLSFFGYPISRPFEEGSYRVQYFERARLELHPEGIMLGLLGLDKVENQLKPLLQVNQFKDNLSLISYAYHLKVPI